MRIPVRSEIALKAGKTRHVLGALFQDEAGTVWAARRLAGEAGSDEIIADWALEQVSAHTHPTVEAGFGAILDRLPAMGAFQLTLETRSRVAWIPWWSGFGSDPEEGVVNEAEDAVLAALLERTRALRAAGQVYPDPTPDLGPKITAVDLAGGEREVLVILQDWRPDEEVSPDESGKLDLRLTLRANQLLINAPDGRRLMTELEGDQLKAHANNDVSDAPATLRVRCGAPIEADATDHLSEPYDAEEGPRAMKVDITDEQMTEGRALLRRLLPGLKREISLYDARDVIQPMSLIGQSLMGRIREENLDALVIRRSAGGWHADLILTGMPAGVSNVMGTPEADPLLDRDAALAAGTQILRQLCRLSMENGIAGRDMPARDVRPFDLHGYVFEIPGEMVDQIGEVWAVVGQAIIPDAEAARAQLTANLTRLMGGDRFDPELYATLPEGERGRLAVNMATLMLFREVRHPDRPVAQPVEEAPSP